MKTKQRKEEQKSRTDLWNTVKKRKMEKADKFEIFVFKDIMAKQYEESPTLFD